LRYRYRKLFPISIVYSFFKIKREKKILCHERIRIQGLHSVRSSRYRLSALKLICKNSYYFQNRKFCHARIRIWGLHSVFIHYSHLLSHFACGIKPSILCYELFFTTSTGKFRLGEITSVLIEIWNRYR
jgi:hypothetical protein